MVLPYATSATVVGCCSSIIFGLNIILIAILSVILTLMIYFAASIVRSLEATEPKGKQ